MVVASSLDNQERQRLQSQYTEIATLAGGLAHEIKNPLSTIGMNLDLIVEDLERADQPRDRRILTKVRTVQNECGHLRRILDEFLQFARLGELTVVESDLNEVVRDFIEFYRPQAQKYGIDVSPHLAADLPAVKIDRSLIRQMLLNLALNAQQAMPTGGLLELQTFVRGGRVHLELIDSGPGMNEATQERMFQVFFSTKADGSGLGLPTVRRIVEAHGGTIVCDSEPGRGTRFTISLPAAD